MVITVTTLPTLPLPAALWLKPRLSVRGLHRLGPRPAPPASFAMAPHMSNAELDRATALHASGKTPVEVCALRQRTRTARGQPGPDLTTVRRALRGSSRKRARVDTRGPKAKLKVVKLWALGAACDRRSRAPRERLGTLKERKRRQGPLGSAVVVVG